MNQWDRPSAALLALKYGVDLSIDHTPIPGTGQCAVDTGEVHEVQSGARLVVRSIYRVTNCKKHDDRRSP